MKLKEIGMLRRKMDEGDFLGYWEVKNKSLDAALNRALLLIEVIGEDHVQLEHTRSRKGKHIISIRTVRPQENTPA